MLELGPDCRPQRPGEVQRLHLPNAFQQEHVLLALLLLYLIGGAGSDDAVSVNLRLFVQMRSRTSLPWVVQSTVCTMLCLATCQWAATRGSSAPSSLDQETVPAGKLKSPMRAMVGVGTGRSNSTLSSLARAALNSRRVVSGGQ